MQAPYPRRMRLGLIEASAAPASPAKVLAQYPRRMRLGLIEAQRAAHSGTPASRYPRRMRLGLIEAPPV